MNTYDLCAVPRCWFFIEENSAFEEGSPYARFVHLDDGEVEHEHDATPSNKPQTLDEWKAQVPALFVRYEDGWIGPNSTFFAVPE